MTGAPRDPADTFARMGQALDAMVRLKSDMLRVGTRAMSTACPRCGGRLHGALVGRRNHIRMWCETPDCIAVME